MARAYNVIDADGHILEPLDLWDKYIDPEFRERRPRFTIDENGKERLKVEGKLLGNPRGIGSLGSVGVRQGDDASGYAMAARGRTPQNARRLISLAERLPSGPFLSPRSLRCPKPNASIDAERH